jgi:acetyl esterase/lipase
VPVLDRIDPEFLPVVTQVPIIDLHDIAAAREELQAVYAAVGTHEPNPGVERSDHKAPGLPGNPNVTLRLFRPIGVVGAIPCLYWIQGGGYVLTAPDLDDAMCEQVALDQRCAVVSVHWRRAPEAPFPAASDDCYAGLLWVFRSGKSLGLDTGRVVLGGASSGAGAAAGVALRLRDDGEFAVAHQLLIYPMLDDRNATPSTEAVTDPELWNRTSNELAWRAYLGSAYGTDQVSPYAAPARMADLSGLAPATILTGELDLFVDENLEYARRLLHAGVSVELHLYPSVHHGFNVHNPEAAMSRRFFADRDAALRRAFGIAASSRPDQT